MANGVADSITSSKNSSGTPAGSGPFGYFTESLSELKKVTTPSRQEAIQASLVTLVIIAFMSISLFVMDLLFHWVVSLLVL